MAYKVTSIKKNALRNSKALTSVTIGANVTKIEEGAFSNCKKLKKITSIGGSTFSGCKRLKSKATIKVPKKKKSAYKKLIINKGKAPKKVKIK